MEVRLRGLKNVLDKPCSSSGSCNIMPASKLPIEDILAPCLVMMLVSEVYLLSQVSTGVHAVTVISRTEMNVYRREWIDEGSRFAYNSDRRFLRWLTRCWAQFAMPLTNDYERPVPDMRGYTSPTEWYDELLRRETSIAMVNEQFIELGARILYSPRIVSAPDRFPDEVDPDMPALMNAPENEPLRTYSEWLIHEW